MKSKIKFLVYELAVIAMSLFVIVGCSDDDDPEPKFDLNLEVYPEDVGDVSGAGNYLDGEQANITASANEGWEFVNWTGDIEHLDDENSPEAIVTMPSNSLVLTANFEVAANIVYGDGVTDIDGNEYVTVIIGDQEWMAENLRVTRDANGNDITRYCYEDDETNCELYGGLYTWTTATNGESSSDSNPSGVQGICPDGWHVPSDAEWTELVDYVESQGYFNNSFNPNGAGNALKSCRQIGSPLGGHCDTSEHPRWDSHNIHSGFDEFGFSALPGGDRLTNGSFSDLGSSDYWWSSTRGSSNAAFYRSMSRISGGVNRSVIYRTLGFSIRCVRELD